MKIKGVDEKAGFIGINEIIAGRNRWRVGNASKKPGNTAEGSPLD